MVTIGQRGAKWLLLALLLSLAVNLFVGGILVGRWFRDQPTASLSTEASLPQRGQRPLLAMFQRITRKLEPEERRLFHDAVLSYRAELRSAFRGVRQARRTLRRTLRAEPYDRQALEAALAELRARKDIFEKTLHSAALDGIERLSPAGRRRLAQ